MRALDARTDRPHPLKLSCDRPESLPSLACGGGKLTDPPPNNIVSDKLSKMRLRTKVQQAFGITGGDEVFV